MIQADNHTTFPTKESYEAANASTLIVPGSMQLKSGSLMFSRSPSVDSATFPPLSTI